MQSNGAGINSVFHAMNMMLIISVLHGGEWSVSDLSCFALSSKYSLDR
jgi:hypothetical protein